MLAVLLCAVLILFPSRALDGAGMGLEICLKAVVPSLLPFMVVSSMALAGGWGEKLGGIFAKVLRPVFGMNGPVSMCFVTGLLGGYPCGARAVAQCADQGLISRSAAERALAFCNNSGPLFILGTAGAAVYNSTKIGAALYICHIIGALAAAAVFGRCPAGDSPAAKLKKVSFGVLVGNAAQAGGAAILSVCALVITFSAVIEALRLYRFPILTGVLEVSRGVKELGRLGISALPLTAACLSWGGFSVHFQTEAVCQGLSKKYYYAGKLISAVVSGTAMLICIKFFGKSIL